MNFRSKVSYALVVGLIFLATAPAVFAQPSGETKININTAPADELANLPGMSKRKAAKVIAGRPYNSADDLSKSGLTARQIEKLKPHITFEAGAMPQAAASPAAGAGAVPSAASTPRHRRTSSNAQAATSTEEGSAGAQTPPQPGMVWVNVKTHVYHVSGDRWYGKTKSGKWMTQDEAIKAGYRKAK
jgi:hypothetical protein